MHTCLNADKIVRLIACELVASGAKGTAVALARCRKNHEDPVLDVLWETQEKLLPLFKSLPGDVWEEDRYIVSAPTTRLFLPLNHFVRKVVWRVLQKTPDNPGMGSLPEVRSKDAKARGP